MLKKMVYALTLTLFVMGFCFLPVSTAKIEKGDVLTKPKVDTAKKLEGKNKLAVPGWKHDRDNEQIRMDRKVRELMLEGDGFITKSQLERTLGEKGFDMLLQDGILDTLMEDDNTSVYYSGRPVPGDTLGVWYTPPTELRVLGYLALFNGGSSGPILANCWTIRDEWDAGMVWDTDDAGFYAVTNPDSFPLDEALGSPIPESIEGGVWTYIDFTEGGTTQGYDVGTTRFFVGYILQGGGANDYDPSILGDAEDTRPRHSIGYLNVYPGWIAYGIDWFIRPVVEYYGDPPPSISVPDLADTYDSEGPYTVTATVTNVDQAGADQDFLAWLIYEIDGEADTLQMMNTEGAKYAADIPGQAVGTTIKYYVYAEDIEGKFATSNVYHFSVGEANPNASILYVDGNDDGTTTYSTRWQDWLDANGYVYDYWLAPDAGRPDLNVLSNYSTVIWNGNWSGAGGLPTANEVGAETSFGMWLDGADMGGVQTADGHMRNLFVSFQDGYNNIFGVEYDEQFTSVAGDFWADYMHLESGIDDDAAQDSVFYGETDDPVSGSLVDYFDANVLSIYTGTDETYTGVDINYPCVITPDPFAVPVFYNETNDDIVGIRFDNEAFRTVLVNFVVDAISDELFNDFSKDLMVYFNEGASPLISDLDGSRWSIYGNDPAPISAKVIDSDGTVEKVELGYRNEKDMEYTWMDMTDMGDNMYQGDIPNLAETDTVVVYKVKATDNDGGVAMSGERWIKQTFVEYTSGNNLLYCGDDPYDWYYEGDVDGMMIETLDAIGAEYDHWDVDEMGTPDYYTVLKNYRDVIWHGYADWDISFPEQTADNPFRHFFDDDHRGNFCFSSEEMLGTWYDWPDQHTFIPGETGYDILGIEWLGPDFAYDTLRVFSTTDPLTAGMDSILALEELPFGYMGDLIDPIGVGTEDQVAEFIMDAWLPDNGAWYSDFGPLGLAWKEDLRSKKVVLPFAIVQLDSANRATFLNNLLAFFDTNVDVEKTPQKSVPDHFVLHRNYPNPFNPSTSIAFDLPKTSVVQLEVYNILGKKIRTLVSEQKVAGEHIVNWNGKTDAGTIAASGIYIYKIKAGDFVQSHKMMLLK